jgi:hypothetical protein
VKSLVTIRKSTHADNAGVTRLVNTVVIEKYGHLQREDLLVFGAATDWDGSWVAEVQDRLVGVGRCDESSIDDLWVAKLETEIALNKQGPAKLRVVSENLDALRFYETNGWRELKRYPHERWGFEMTDMIKDV